MVLLSFFILEQIWHYLLIVSFIFHFMVLLWNPITFQHSWEKELRSSSLMNQMSSCVFPEDGSTDLTLNLEMRTFLWVTCWSFCLKMWQHEFSPREERVWENVSTLTSEVQTFTEDFAVFHNFCLSEVHVEDGGQSHAKQTTYFEGIWFSH